MHFYMQSLCLQMQRNSCSVGVCASSAGPLSLFLAWIYASYSDKFLSVDENHQQAGPDWLLFLGQADLGILSIPPGGSIHKNVRVLLSLLLRCPQKDLIHSQCQKAEACLPALKALTAE